MKYLGIDYGTKRIGIAVSDESGMMAFPRGILSGGKSALEKILDTVREERIDEIVVGKSMDQKGNRNAIMDDIDVFVEQIHNLTGLPVHTHDERFSSHMARSFDFTKNDMVANPRKHDRVEHIDDRAAAVMLQRYLDMK